MTSLKRLRVQYPEYEDLSDGDFLFGLRQKFYPDVHPRTFFDTVDGATNAHATIKMFRDEYRADVQKPIEGEDARATSQRLGGTADGPVGDSGGKALSTARSVLQGLTFGAGDELVAGGASLLSGSDYSEELQKERDRLEIGRDQSPIGSTIAEIGGALAVPGAALKAVKGRPVSTAAKSGVMGALGAGIYGFNAGEGGFDERLDNAQSAAIVGGVLGAGAPMVGGLLERAANTRAAKSARDSLAKVAPDLDALRARASGVFSSADTVGLPTVGLPNAVQDIQAQIGARPLNPGITPRAAGVMQELEDVATSPSASVMFGDLQDVRRKAGAAAADFTNPTEQRAAGIIQDGIDEFVESVDPALGAQIAEARKMWSQLRKSEAIQEVVEKAQRQASGFENGLRIGIRQILNSKKRRAGFSKDEIAAMKSIVEGTGFGNVMKKLGRLSFGMGQQTNVLSGLTGSGVAGGLGAATLGPMGALLGVIPPVVGYGAKRASEKSTEKAVRGLMGLIAEGSPPVNQISPMGRGLLDELARRGARAQVPLGLPELVPMLQTEAVSGIQ